MKPLTVTKIYFSPTGTTEKIVSAVSEGIGADNINLINLTPGSSSEKFNIENGAAVIGIPVYAGRVPETFIERFLNINASGIPAVLIALYGNRNYDDALLELSNLAEKKGFNVIAAGAFIGEHSYSTEERPIAEGRPLKDDLDAAIVFGRQISDKIKKGDFTAPEIPGNYPYRDGVISGNIAPLTDENKCIKCKECENICPVNAVRVSDSVLTDTDNCIMCCACIKICSEGARFFSNEKINDIRDKLYNNFSTPKKAELFI